MSTPCSDTSSRGVHLLYRETVELIFAEVGLRCRRLLYEVNSMRYRLRPSSAGQRTNGARSSLPILAPNHIDLDHEPMLAGEVPQTVCMTMPSTTISSGETSRERSKRVHRSRQGARLRDPTDLL